MSFPTYNDMKESGIAWVGKIPIHWECARLKNVFQLMKRPPEPSDGIVTAFRDGEVTLRSNRRLDGYTNAIHEHGYQRVLPSDLVIHAMDAFAGAIGVSDSTGKSSPVYSVCRQRDPGFDVRYFGRLLRYMALSGYVNSLAKGIRERSTEFRWKESANIVVPIPPPEEQKAIAKFLNITTSPRMLNANLVRVIGCFVHLPERDRIQQLMQLDTGVFSKLQVEVERAKCLLRERRASLIGAAVTGEIDVRNSIEANQ